MQKLTLGIQIHFHAHCRTHYQFIISRVSRNFVINQVGSFKRIVIELPPYSGKHSHNVIINSVVSVERSKSITNFPFLIWGMYPGKNTNCCKDLSSTSLGFVCRAQVLRRRVSGRNATQSGTCELRPRWGRASRRIIFVCLSWYKFRVCFATCVCVTYNVFPPNSCSSTFGQTSMPERCPSSELISWVLSATAVP